MIDQHETYTDTGGCLPLVVILVIAAIVAGVML